MKIKLCYRSIFVFLVMFVAAGLAVVLKPTQLIAEQRPPIYLNAMIPKSFNGWELEDSESLITISQDAQAKIDEIYSQTLARTYVNKSGDKIMLSIAYGADQSGEKTQVHRPEYCYVAQGFDVKKIEDKVLTFGDVIIPVRRLFASNQNRLEPITYWLIVGNKATLPGISRKIQQLKYGLTGKVPDGMLVRVSSLASDIYVSYKIQEDFLIDLRNALTKNNKNYIFGYSASSNSYVFEKLEEFKVE